MIKNFEQFLCESNINVSNYTHNKKTHYTELIFDLAHECDLYNIEFVKSRGGKIKFDKVESLYFYKDDNSKDEVTLDVIALEVKQEEYEDEAVTTSKNEKGEYLVAITTDDEEMPIDIETCTIYTTLDINDILNSYY
jgi:hypothetical protein